MDKSGLIANDSKKFSSGKKIIDQINTGDYSAIKNLVKKYSGALIHFGNLKFPGIDSDILFDALNDSFLKIIDTLDNFEYTTDQALWRWICKIFINTVVSDLRSKQALKRGGREYLLSIDTLNELGIEPISNEDTEREFEQKNILDKILKDLPEKYQLVLLYYAKGYPDKEIANIFCISKSAAKSLRRRAIEKAQQLLQILEID